MVDREVFSGFFSVWAKDRRENDYFCFFQALREKQIPRSARNDKRYASVLALGVLQVEKGMNVYG
jgi:hypothetical protein